MRRVALLYLYAETPVHAGGGTSVGVVDNPIQREAGTTYPVVKGESLKGALRALAVEMGMGRDRVNELFGDEIVAGESAPRPGQLAIDDAQLVALPVPTLTSTFAWATSAVSLARLSEKLWRAARVELRTPVPADGALATPGSSWNPADEIFGITTSPVSVDAVVGEWASYLADHAFVEHGVFEYFRDKLRRDLVVLDDADFTANATFGTEISTRNRLDGDKRVVPGGLFTAEYLPTETLLVSMVASRDAEHLRDLARLIDDSGSLFQLGGGESIGKGQLWARLVETEQP